jgi:2-desacetyl-2-hydroxyethyl bacteriochlorophyllide A dehydrogenase
MDEGFMNKRAVYFTAPRQIEIREESIPDLQPGEILVQTLLSAISSGTESLIYQGLFPTDLRLDENLPGLTSTFAFPLKYGYSAVGRVVELGAGLEKTWLNRLVFAFVPHQSHFTASIADVQPLPADLAPEDAVFLPNMETAVNLVMDGAPIIGENIAVFGQGVIGMLTTTLLARFPLNSLVTLDPVPTRRQRSLQLGATASLAPNSPEAVQYFSNLPKGGADLTFELSGSPPALDQAIQATGFAGRIVIGSWYGQKHAHLDLGGRFHRNRLHMISSQVSSLAPGLSGRWDKARRFDLVWQMLRVIQPSQLITQRVPLDQAAQAYQMLAEQPTEALQVVFTYD